MPVSEIGEALRALRYRRGEYAREPARLRLIARIHSVLRPGSVSRLIFKATIVERVPYKMIARELSISLRQFFRLRNQMIEEIETGLGEHRIEVHDAANDDRDALELACRALEHGHTAIANQTLKSVSDRPLDIETRIETLILQARAYFDSARSSEALDRLEEASAAAARYDGAQRARLARDIALTRAYGLYRDGSYDAALELSQRVLPLHAIVPSADPAEARKMARHSLFLALQHEEGGSPEEALEYLRAAHDVLRALDEPPAAEIAQIHVHRAFVRAGMASEVAAAPGDAYEAVRLAQWHGLTAELVWGNLALAMTTYASQPQDASRWASRAMQLGEMHLAGDPLARTLFIGSRFECAAGRGADAVRHVMQAEPHVRNNNLLLAIYHLAEARAREASGELEKTADAASRAIAMMEGRSHSHYIGLAYLKRASSRLNLGERNVREDVDAAIGYLERGAPLNDRMEALSLSAAVTLNRVHRREAEELRVLLSSAAG